MLEASTLMRQAPRRSVCAYADSIESYEDLDVSCDIAGTQLPERLQYQDLYGMHLSLAWLEQLAGRSRIPAGRSCGSGKKHMDELLRGDPAVEEHLRVLGWPARMFCKMATKLIAHGREKLVRKICFTSRRLENSMWKSFV